jgi:hypothetical protein
MQCIAHSTLQPAAVHAVVAFGVADHRLDGLAAFEPPSSSAKETLINSPLQARGMLA